MDYSPPGSSVHGVFQARILEQVAISYSRGSSQPRDQTHAFVSSALASVFFTTVLPGKLINISNLLLIFSDIKVLFENESIAFIVS